MPTNPIQPVLDFEARFVRNLLTARMLPASWDKRFAREMGERLRLTPEGKPGEGAVGLTPRQWENVTRLVWKYRRQMPSGLIHRDPKNHPIALPEVDTTEYRRERSIANGVEPQAGIHAATGWRETIRPVEENDDDQ